MYYDQSGYDLRCEWGLAGLHAVAGSVDAIVIVDVLSFSTAVDVAVSRGAFVYPYRWRDSSAQEFAAAKGALLAGRRGAAAYSLSPVSLTSIPAGSSLVLPSPNGSTLSLAANGIPTFVGCFRNASQVAARAATRGPRIAVICAGERWEDGSIRLAAEDLIGAGAVLDKLPGSRSPEAEIAVAGFRNARARMAEVLSACSSGRELIEAGFEQDVALAAQHDVSSAAPVLFSGRFVDDADRAKP